MANLEVEQWRSEARPAFVSGRLTVSKKEPPKDKPKDPPKKLTRAEKDAKIKPLKDTLAELSTGMDTVEKQQARRLLLKQWQNIEKDLPIDEAPLPNGDY